MTRLIYDGSFEGFLTAIFTAYEQRITEISIRKTGSDEALLFTQIVHVTTDENKAARVWTKLLALFGKNGVRTLWKAWLSERETIDDAIFGTIRYALGTRGNVLDDYGDPDVLALQQAVKSVGREKHRMEAFVRFQLTKDDLYYAVIDPDFNVLPLIAEHFENRYADQRWLIFDVRRKFGAYYDLTATEFVDFLPNELVHDGQPLPDALHEAETAYSTLWNDYFRSTNIASRKNMKLHVQHVPKRYWKYLTEKK